MRFPSACYWTFLFLSTLSSLRMDAQSSPKDNSIPDSAIAAAVHAYHAYVTPEVGLYRGTEYLDYDFKVQQGHPFLGTDVFRSGSVWYGGIEYDNVAMEYNLVKEQLVILDPFNVFKISLHMDMVDSFAVGGHLYFRNSDSLAPSILRSGYCDRIHEGRFVLLKRDQKSLVTSVISLNNPQYSIDESIHYYILKNGAYQPVNNKGQLFQALGDRKRSEIRKVMRESGLEWPTDKERLLLLVAAWYDGVNH